MKGDILLGVLETIFEGTVAATDMFFAFLDEGYGASYSKLEYEFLKHQRNRNGAPAKKNFEREAKQKYHKLIYKLKNEGIIFEKEKRHKKFFVLTKRGFNKLKVLRDRRQYMLPRNNYQVVKAKTLSIVVFDIPEREKRKREWLRGTLKRIGFVFLQKSVWVGKVKLPRQFLEDLHQLRLIDFVEIFQISKTGSLKPII